MTISQILKGWFDANRNYWNDLRDQKSINDQETVEPSKLYGSVHSDTAPIFVLSTGRCGTQLLTQLLEKSESVIVEHHPIPEPTWHANWAYHNIVSNYESVKATIDGMRYEMIRDTYLTKKIYIETSNRITFFAPALAALYPRAKFIHLYRHPEKFIASGLGRRWYDGVMTDEGRLEPADPQIMGWSKMRDAEKIGWLWNETNQFIEDFKLTLSKDRQITVKAEDLFSDESIAESIFQFCGVGDIDRTLVAEAISVPVNAQAKSKRTQFKLQDERGIMDYIPLAKSYYKA